MIRLVQGGLQQTNYFAFNFKVGLLAALQARLVRITFKKVSPKIPQVFGYLLKFKSLDYPIIVPVLLHCWLAFAVFYPRLSQGSNFLGYKSWIPLLQLCIQFVIRPTLVQRSESRSQASTPPCIPHLGGHQTFTASCILPQCSWSQLLFSLTFSALCYSESSLVLLET